MDDIGKIEWGLIWEITKDTILPHMGTLVLNTILFVIVGFLLSIIFVILLSKKRVFKRIPKYYNWAVKLYIPILIGVCLYVFGQIGFLRGVYVVLNKEKSRIVTSIYEQTLGLAFESEQSKSEFLKWMQIAAKDATKGSNWFAESMKNKLLDPDSGISPIDKSNNKTTTYLVEKYQKDIYKICVYGLLSHHKTGDYAIMESISYEEFSTAIDFLLDIGHNDIELAIKDRLTIWFVSLLDYQYQSMIKSLLILLLGIMGLPLVEFFIYKKWIEAKLIGHV
ncbi:hypothetical protein FVB32_09065 [Flagellimonas hymeniacidonis]|uniref:Uncharacterized protein n=1 Tax=Flagellimonas hymeniacidonis TaxID=2603628 RepID=A0A5C8UYZ9_9FLAO|nr:hypothetical protein [Flagellimonas hymeniacidonis]TXN34743.1 hypothetical protein FVB32_09065 [Flagellimonas hymeniacidonis]